MAKHQNGKVDKEAGKTKTTIHLDGEWFIALNLLATSKSMSMSAFIQSLVSTHLSGLPRKESDAIRAIVSVNTGKSLRLGKDSGHSAVKTEETEEATEESRGLDGAISRTNRITNIQSRLLNAVDSVVDDFGK